MPSHRFFRPKSNWFGALIFGSAILSLAPAAWSAPNSGTDTKSDAGNFIFTNRSVLRLRIEIPKEGIATLRKYQWGWGGGESQERSVVKGTVREGDTVLTNVAIHLKGAAGSFRPVDANPCLTLNFSKFIKGQLFHGLDKISLNNSVQDPS